MSQHDVLFSITEDGRDGINFQVWGSEINNILNQKEEVLEVMERLKKALINEKYPFTRVKPKHKIVYCFDCKIEEIIDYDKSDKCPFCESENIERR